jgi:hypothetical protein
MARAENPHCGKFGVPFMKSTTGLEVTVWRMRSWVSMAIFLVCEKSMKDSVAKP